MRIALVADLHGNRPATLALERDLARTQPDRVLCLGDIVGKGPSNDFTFDWAMPVSYTHLDVYKRQVLSTRPRSCVLVPKETHLAPRFSPARTTLSYR